MKSKRFFGWVGIASLLVVIGTGACGRDPEHFCESVVEDTCQALSSCCKDGAKFDINQCRLNISRGCQQFTNVERVHAGEVVFDSGAASDCFGEVTSCESPTELDDDSFARTKACENMLSGFRPAGAACDSDDECEAGGEYSTCFRRGQQGGFCANAILDDEKCGFSFETNELHVCSDGKFCDDAGFTPEETDPPTIKAFEFSAKCRNNIGNGQSCIGADNRWLPCSTGLFCDQTGSDVATCTKRRGAGESCDFTGECKAGLECNSADVNRTCQEPKGSSLFCFDPADTCSPNGQSCLQNTDCCGGFCLGDVCNGGP
jgi:hypothetical protein